MSDDKSAKPLSLELKEQFERILANTSQTSKFSEAAKEVAAFQPKINFGALDFSARRRVEAEARAEPPKVVRFSRLKGYGEETIDLDQCLRIMVGVRPHPDAPYFVTSTVTVYYITPNHRGIIGLGGMAQVDRGGAGYREVHPLEIAFALHLHGLALPPELERYRPFLQADLTVSQMISAWEKSPASRTQAGVEPTHLTIEPPTVVASPSQPVEADFASIKAACRFTALSKSYVSKLCSRGVITTNGVTGRGRRLSMASLAEFLASRDPKT
jgi:hypothetical protein